MKKKNNKNFELKRKGSNFLKFGSYQMGLLPPNGLLLLK